MNEWSWSSFLIDALGRYLPTYLVSIKVRSGIASIISPSLSPHHTHHTHPIRKGAYHICTCSSWSYCFIIQYANPVHQNTNINHPPRQVCQNPNALPRSIFLHPPRNFPSIIIISSKHRQQESWNPKAWVDHYRTTPNSTIHPLAPHPIPSLPHSASIAQHSYLQVYSQ